MSFRHYALTLSGAAQRLSSVLGDTQPGGTQDVACRQIFLAADPANGNVIYIGGASPVVSAESHAFSLDPTQATQLPVSIGPFNAGPVKLSEIWALGTASQRLMIGIVEY